MAVKVEEWLRVIKEDYLANYIPNDGFAVKFAVVEWEGIATVATRLESSAAQHELLWAPIDAAVTKLHLMHDLFFAIARQIEWNDTAQGYVEELLARNAYLWPNPGSPANFHAVADANSIAEHLLKREVRQWLTTDIWEDSLLSQDFRAAMMRLCLNRFEPDLAGPDPDPVVQWLRGDLPRIGALKNEDIFTKITRANARAMLASLCHWLAKTGAKGILVFIDISQLARKGADAIGGNRYTKASVMDAYEVLRQIIDDAEHYQRFMLVAAGTPALIDGNDDRAISEYQALKMRIWDEVRPSGRDNPVDPLVRLTQ